MSEKQEQKQAKQGKQQGKNDQTAKQQIRSGLQTFSLDKNNFSDWFDAILDAAEIVDRRYPVKGQPILRPYGFYAHNSLMRRLELLYEQAGVHQVLFPTSIPLSFLQTEQEHIKGFEKECYWIDRGGLEKLDEPLALRPTSETAMYSMFQYWVRSFRDLPLKVHQTVTVFRYETKNTRPLIRQREIPWNEAHTIHATEEEALQQIVDYWRCYDILFNDIGVFGLRLRRAEWDKFAGAVFTEVSDVVMPCGRVLQSAGIHYLGQKFTIPFKVSFQDENNKAQFPYSTCAGVSTRLLACALAMHGDNNGLVMPESIAQFQIVIIPCGKPSEKLTTEIGVLCETLKAAGHRTITDMNPNQSMGDKLYYWEMKGVPMRIEMGARDLEKGECVVTMRDIGKDGKKTVKVADICNIVMEEFEAYHERLIQQGRKNFEAHITTCRSLEEAKKAIEEIGGFIRMPFKVLCKEFEEKIREIVPGAEIRGYVHQECCEGEKCAISGDDATIWGYVARAY